MVSFQVCRLLIQSKMQALKLDNKVDNPRPLEDAESIFSKKNFTFQFV